MHQILSRIPTSPWLWDLASLNSRVWNLTNSHPENLPGKNNPPQRSPVQALHLFSLLLPFSTMAEAPTLLGSSLPINILNEVWVPTFPPPPPPEQRQGLGWVEQSKAVTLLLGKHSASEMERNSRRLEQNCYNFAGETLFCWSRAVTGETFSWSRAVSCCAYCDLWYSLAPYCQDPFASELQCLQTPL